MSYVQIVCHCEDCPENESRECKYTGQLEIQKVNDEEKKLHAECSVYRELKSKYVGESNIKGPGMV
jgi:hypothetical protein